MVAFHWWVIIDKTKDVDLTSKGENVVFRGVSNEFLEVASKKMYPYKEQFLWEASCLVMKSMKYILMSNIVLFYYLIASKLRQRMVLKNMFLGSFIIREEISTCYKN